MGRKIIADNRYIGTREGDPSVTVSNALLAYVHNLTDKQIAPETIKTYKTHINLFIRYLNTEYVFAQGGKNVQQDTFLIKDVTKLHVEQYQGYCRRRGNRPATIKSYVRSLRAFLYWCMDEAHTYIPKEYKIPLPPAEEAIKEPYTEEEIAIIAAEPTGDDLTEWRNWAAINTFLRTGLRLSSLCELKWTDIDYENRRVLIRHEKNKRQHYVPLSSDAIDVLTLWDQITPTTKEGYIFFSTYTEGKITPKGLYSSIRKYNLARGIEKTSVHLMRHTFSTIYLRKGGSSDKLQRILNHETREMTDKYVHFVAEDLADGIDDFTV